MRRAPNFSEEFGSDGAANHDGSAESRHAARLGSA
jgi:hypothetical protein